MGSEDVPEGRCGFVLQPEDVELGDFYEDGKEWYMYTQAVCCYRETWDNADRCIWHAEIDEKSVDELAETRTTKEERLDGAYLSGVQAEHALSFAGCSLIGSDLTNGGFSDADLSEANLKRADLSEANLRGADLSEADLRGADLSEETLKRADLSEVNLSGADLSEAILSGADLSEAILSGADLSEAILSGADLSEANLSGADLNATALVNADFEGTDLEDASLVQTDLRRADLQNAKLYQTYFSDVRINSDTDFGDTCVYETPEELDDYWAVRWDATSTEAAVWTYRRLQDLHEKYALTEDARNYHIRKEEAEKRRHKEEGNYAKWAIYAGNGLVSKHGESPWRVVGVSGAVILIWSFLYLLLGKIRVPKDPSGTEPIGHALFPSISFSTPVAEALTSIYFSVVTFTTLGYGDLQPATGFAQALATVESFLGALLMAYLVFVLGRRTNW